jgi:hypothetical protein
LVRENEWIIEVKSVSKMKVVEQQGQIYNIVENKRQYLGISW